jgi:hypothetical protein
MQVAAIPVDFTLAKIASTGDECKHSANIIPVDAIVLNSRRFINRYSFSIVFFKIIVFDEQKKHLCQY